MKVAGVQQGACNEVSPGVTGSLFLGEACQVLEKKSQPYCKRKYTVEEGNSYFDVSLFLCT